jgi:hypothetical protein
MKADVASYPQRRFTTWSGPVNRWFATGAGPPRTGRYPSSPPFSLGFQPPVPREVPTSRG